MIVYQPDPHPGRCRNLRPSVNAYAEARRCLEMDGHDGRCRFPEERPAENLASGGGVYSTPQPKPWVVPAADTEGKDAD